MSIGSEEVPIAADRARDGKFESTPLQRRVRGELDPTASATCLPMALLVSKTQKSA